MRTLEWDTTKQELKMIDQRLLPNELHVIALKTHEQVAEAIQNMVVRGAPAIGAAAGFGLALAAKNSQSKDNAGLMADLKTAGDYLKASRPTAVNLAWAVERILQRIDETSRDISQLKDDVLSEAQCIADEDVTINKRMAAFGAALMGAGETVIHHCNTGSLATVDWGTALGVIHTAHEQGKHPHVLVDETRPRLQGARLTAWELDQYGISYDIISDNAAGYFLETGQVDKVFVGADRVAANGDTANKIGTYMLALAAKDNRVPFYVVAPFSSIDFELAEGHQIPIEERNEDEVLHIERDGKRFSPLTASARNPAFDITPHRLITAIITEFGVIEPPFADNLLKNKRQDKLEWK